MWSNAQLTVLVLVTLFALLAPTVSAQAAAAAAANAAAANAANAAAANAAAATAAAAAAANAAAESTLTYTAQTGATRYAPMQVQPKTTITAKSASRQYPTSSYSVFKTYAAIPSIETTVTASWTYKVTSSVNTAAAQSGTPTADVDKKKRAMEKYLKRWMD